MLNVLFLVLAGTTIASAAESDLSKLPPPATNQVDFVTDIKPIFEKSCFRCHGPERPKSGFRLDNREAALKGGDHGEAIVPGHSERSALILYVARLDPDMAMPPEGKGDPLTSEQVGLLRAWIDQGAAWPDESGQTQATVTLAPAVGFVTVHGNEAKFREHWWMRDQWRGGVESFELSQWLAPDAKLTFSGRAMTDDYRVEMLAEKRELGFAHFGFEQFRKYDSDTGGYVPTFSPQTFSFDRDLHLDMSRLWIDFGLTRRDWPRIVLGYEYQVRTGNKATLQWGPVGTTFLPTPNPDARNIFPAYKAIDEHTHILKFDLDYESAGWRVEDNFRGEWVELRTRRENVEQYELNIPGPSLRDTVREGWQSFQGANTVRVERQFKDWMFGSVGYLYSHLSGDADFSLDVFIPSVPPLIGVQWRSQRIVLERESHVGNLNLLFGSWQGVTLALGAQGEWTRQNGTLEGVEDEIFAPPPSAVLGVADIARSVVDESAALRVTRLPFTTMFAEARLQQEWIGHSEELQGGHSFMRDTDARSDGRDLRAGFDTSPRAWLKFGSHYRNYDKSTTYDGAKNPVGDPFTDLQGYPTVISSRDRATQEVESRLTLRPLNWLKTTFTYRLVAKDYHTRTESVSVNAANDASPGGRVFAGNYDAQTFSLSTTLNPWRRLYLVATVSYQDVRSVAMHDYTAAVMPYRGHTWSVMNHGRYVLTKKTDLTAGYTFSTAGFRQRNFNSGLPVGMDYDLHGMQVGLVSRCTKNLTTKLQYGFYRYAEPSSGGANDYTAHAVFASLSLRLP